jgi:hypothetical protein
MVTGLQHVLQRFALLCFLACIVYAAPPLNTFTLNANAHFVFKP